MNPKSAWDLLESLFSCVMPYRKEPMDRDTLSSLLAERRDKGERAAELQFVIAREREEACGANPEARAPARLDRLRGHVLELIALTERLAEIDSQPLRTELDDLTPAESECFEKTHLLRMCKQLREEALRQENKAIEADVAWHSLQAHMRAHGC